MNECMAKTLAGAGPAARADGRAGRDAGAEPDAREAGPLEASVWRSEGGSLYLFDGEAFTCIAIHEARFAGWIGKQALARVWRAGPVGGGLQAFRDMRSGTLAEWVPVELRFEHDVITKTFPRDRPLGMLVYGPVERYVRCTT